MQIRAYLERTGESKEAFASRCGIPLSTFYRWLEEEEKYGAVRGITAPGLLKLSEGSKGMITVDAVIGIGRKGRRRAA